MFDFIQNMIVQSGGWGALGFFLGAFLEEVAAPFPSPLLLVGVAFFFGKPLSLLVVGKIMTFVILPIVAGATLGSLVVYALAYSGGKSVIGKFQKWLGFSWGDVEKLQEKISRKNSDEWVLFLSRCIPFTPTTLITIIAGIVRMNIWTYTVLTFLGIFVRVTGLFIGAFIFGQAIFK